MCGYGVISLTASPSHVRHASPPRSALPLALSVDTVMVARRGHNTVPLAANPNHVTFAREVQTRFARWPAAETRCDITADQLAPPCVR